MLRSIAFSHRPGQNGPSDAAQGMELATRESNCFDAMTMYLAAVHSLHRRPQTIMSTVKRDTAMAMQPEETIMLYTPTLSIHGVKHMAPKTPKQLRTKVMPI